MECETCGMTMMDAQFCAGMHGVPPYLMRKKKGVFEPEHRAAVDCFVCPKCGKVELYAKDVKELFLS